MFENVIARAWLLAPVIIISLFFSWGLIVLLRPWLARHALAHPNARSSHEAPTPQGGGVAVTIAVVAASAGAAALVPSVTGGQGAELLALTAAMVLLAVVGAVDDMQSLGAAPRLAMQSIAVGAIISALPSDFHFLPHLPWWVERACLFLGGLWFVNLVNFMDGIDWMTVAEFVPAAGAITLLGLTGEVGLLPALLAAALLGAVLGFAPFNKPVARLFLGDVGSLPMGLLLGWLLLKLAEKGHLAAALILPLYYCADATITLAWRVARRQPFWEAHREHFYQRARNRGLAVRAIVGRVFFANLGLAALAVATFAAPELEWMALLAAAAVVAFLLVSLVGGTGDGDRGARARLLHR
jgi:UDP-N-acetylmuramyl pentapeptide phosphotransferase/UDP-N-acetylglucosamine-1-phosphate transferase